MARPLIEVYSVEIFSNSLPCQLYGKISVRNDGDDDDDSGPTYTIYTRDYDHPEVISRDGQQLLISGSDVPISIPNPVMTVHIFDGNKALDESFKVCCTRLLDNTIQGYYDADKSCVFDGEHGYVKVNYITMAFGTIFEVSILLDLAYPGVAEKLKEPSRTEVSDKDFPVYGTIVARYVNTNGNTTCDSSLRVFNLLKVPSDGFMPLCFTTHKEIGDLRLTRQFVAVPAYSSLEIKVDLKESYTDEPFLSGSVIERAAMLFSNCRNPAANVVSKTSCLSVVLLDPSVDFDLSLVVDKLASMSLDRKQRLPGWSDSESLLEVYSVFIGRENGEDLSVSGEIGILHSNSPNLLYLFKRDEENADELVDGKELLSISGPSSPFEFMVADDYFHLTMELKDAKNHFNISEGYINFNTYMHVADNHKFDKLLCSVIEDECGFCAVHYTIFSKAVGVEVKCVVLCKNGVDDANMYGKVSASYDMFNYTFDRDRKYYRRVLFDKSENDKVFLPRKVASKKAEESLMSDCDEQVEAEFSRSYVAMPIGHTLFLHIDLHVSSHPERRSYPEHFDSTLQFELGGNSPEKINGEDFDILVHVEMIPKSKWLRK